MLREGIYKKEYIEEGEEDKRESTRTLSPRMIDSSPSFSPLTLSLSFVYSIKLRLLKYGVH